MKCIIPLAGPDIYSEEMGLKPAFPFQGKPLISKIIHSRHWFGDQIQEQDLLFVIRSMSQIRELRGLLTSQFPAGRIIEIPDLTNGALLSTLSGVAMITDYDEPIIVDLADIFFSCNIDLVETFRGDDELSGIIPCFTSDYEKYSYLEINHKGDVLRTREKQVISESASAGVYMYRNLRSFLAATLFSVDNRDDVSHNNLLYLCPSFNGIIGTGQRVKALEVSNIVDVSFAIQDAHSRK